MTAVGLLLALSVTGHVDADDLDNRMKVTLRTASVLRVELVVDSTGACDLVVMYVRPTSFPWACPPLSRVTLPKNGNLSGRYARWFQSCCTFLSPAWPIAFSQAFHTRLDIRIRKRGLVDGLPSGLAIVMSGSYATTGGRFTLLTRRASRRGMGRQCRRGLCRR